MRLVCGTCSAVYEAPREGELRCSACSARPLIAGDAPGSARTRSSLPGERWFVRTERGQLGPFTASQLSRQLAEGRLEWTSDVWRDGLGGFRAARRDERLVLAVAHARGLAGATMRLDSVQSLLHSSDMRLDLPTPLSVSARPSVPPSVVARGSLSSPRPLHKSRTLWLLTLAFFVGAVVAVGPEHLGALALALPRGLRVQVSSSPHIPAAVTVARSEPPVSAPLSSKRALVRASDEPTPAPNRLAPLEGVTRAVPARAELQTALVRAGPQLLRCLSNPRRGLTLALTLEGQSGSVQSLQVTAPTLRPGELECVNESFVDFRVPPFIEPVWQLKHRYVW